MYRLGSYVLYLVTNILLLLIKDGHSFSNMCDFLYYLFPSSLVVVFPLFHISVVRDKNSIFAIISLMKKKAFNK